MGSWVGSEGDTDGGDREGGIVGEPMLLVELVGFLEAGVDFVENFGVVGEFQREVLYFLEEVRSGTAGRGFCFDVDGEGESEVHDKPFIQHNRRGVCAPAQAGAHDPGSTKEEGKKAPLQSEWRGPRGRELRLGEGDAGGVEDEGVEAVGVGLLQTGGVEVGFERVAEGTEGGEGDFAGGGSGGVLEEKSA